MKRQLLTYPFPGEPPIYFESTPLRNGQVVDEASERNVPVRLEDFTLAL